MTKDLHATDRVVLVGAGFGVWHAGRHLASARWTDVVRVRALTRDDVTSDLLQVSLSLRDGTEVVMHEKLPGFEQFLAAAEARLPGMRRQAPWRAAGTQPVFLKGETVLFERQGV